MRLRSSGLVEKDDVVKDEAESLPRRAEGEAQGLKREKEDETTSLISKKKVKKAKTKKERAPRAEPSGWKEILRGIEQMRAKKDAEVDKYGCEVFFDENIPPHVCRLHVLISAMLSSQTKDPVNAAAMGRLIKHGLTVKTMLEIDQHDLAQLIRPVGFFNYKAKYIKQTVLILSKQAEAEGKDVVDIPSTYEELIALPGVGPKMATLVMNCAWKNTVGICVDTHVHRISNRLKWVKTWNKNNPKSQDPEKTRAELEDWLPKEHWGPINPLLVGLGQTICLPRGPKCSECKIQNICPSANSSAI
ncbi:Helix-hairpin-helix motif-containing protein [Phytophthora infestans]|nr:Helix-hairpin-helix motif-containing protein [Phytophthora infestans]